MRIFASKARHTALQSTAYGVGAWKLLVVPVHHPDHPVNLSQTSSDPSAVPDLTGPINQWLADELPGLLGRQRRQPMFRPLVDEVTALVNRPGKRIRPLLFLQGHGLFSPEAGGGADLAGLIPAAAGLEILHAFILVHDDLIDESDERRGQPSLHRAFERRLAGLRDRPALARRLALIGGDVLFAAAQMAVYKSVLPPERKERMLHYLLTNLIDTGWGEAADVMYGARDISSVSQMEIAEMYWLKTTRYTIEGPLWLGGIAAGAEEAELMPLAAIARPLGLAFQIANDLKDFDAAMAAGGSSDDLDCSKKTLLVAEAFQRLGGTEQTLLQLALSAERQGESTAAVIRDLISRCGAADELRRRQAALMEEARVAIDSAPYPEARIAGFHRLVDQMQRIIAGG